MGHGRNCTTGGKHYEEKKNPILFHICRWTEKGVKKPDPNPSPFLFQSSILRLTSHYKEGGYINFIELLLRAKKK